MVAIPHKENIRSVFDASKRGYKIGALDGSSSAASLRSMTDEGKLNVQLLFKPKETDYTSFLSYYIERELNAMMYCDYLSAIHIDGGYAIDIVESSEQSVSFTFQKDSPYSPLFNYHLQKMHEDGVIHRLRMKWLPKQQTGSSSDQPLSLGYNNLVFPFLALVFGCSSALVISICERFIKLNDVENEHLEMKQVTNLNAQRLEMENNALITANIRIFELETDRNKLRAEILELRSQLGCYYSRNDNSA